MKQLNLQWKRLALAVLIALPLGMIACEDEAPPAPPSAPAQPGAPAEGSPEAAQSANATPSDLPPLPVADFAERDFQESPANRDPFKNFTEQFDAPRPDDAPTDKQEVLVGKYALEELKIVGIVTGTVARVLVQDPTGLGWVLRVGDFVGREEGVRGGQGTTVPVHWRLDRIRQNDVVFIRESPDPSTPATTRVISMRSPDELKQEIRTGIRGTRPDETPPASSAGASKG